MQVMINGVNYTVCQGRLAYAHAWKAQSYIAEGISVVNHDTGEVSSWASLHWAGSVEIGSEWDLARRMSYVVRQIKYFVTNEISRHLKLEDFGDDDAHAKVLAELLGEYITQLLDEEEFQDFHVVKLTFYRFNTIHLPTINDGTVMGRILRHAGV